MAKHKTYEPTILCVACGGKCCKLMPGHYSPKDFSDLTFGGLRREIEKGGIAIDWWESPTGKEYYLRARTHFEPIVHGSWGGVCVNLTPTGCSLPWNERPLGCRNLKPDEYACLGTYKKEVCKNEWKKYASVLEDLVEYFRGV